MARLGTLNPFDVLRRAAHPITGAMTDYDPLLERVSGAGLALLGEATHGSHEFYAARAEISRRLITEQGFAAITVEADWPDAYRVNRYVRGLGDDTTALEALGDFERFPRWIWRNAEMLEFVAWLRAFNERRPSERRVGFYGLDLYSLHASAAAVIEYLERIDPEAAVRARARYACFDHAEEDPQQYGYAAALGLRPDCEDETVQQLLELQRQRTEAMRRAGVAAADERFFAEQNARVVRHAEEHYREMFGGRVNSWNLRDRHMADTLDALRRHLARGADARLIVWAHNSHVGDAGATEMSRRGEFNIGQLARERHGRDAVLVGFTTHTGTVAAATDWDQPVQRQRIRPALPDSYEALLHNIGLDRFLLMTHQPEVREILREQRLQRAIGVVYRPQTERWSHYFRARLPDQFDAVLHFDQTRALEPLDPGSGWESEQTPETYPLGL